MSDIEKTVRQQSTIGGYGLAIAKALDYSGVDSERVFRAAGIPLHLTNDPLIRLPLDALTRLYKSCVEVTNNPYFGLTVARFIHISNLHALGYALAASDTLMDFCRRITHYFRLASDSAAAVLFEADGHIDLRFEHLAAVSGETEDALLGFIVQAMRQLSETGFAPLAVGFHHPMPRGGDGPYQDFFRAAVMFEQPASFLLLRKSDLNQPLAGACPELAQLNDQIAAKYLARLDKSDLTTLVRQKIIELLPNGDCDRDSVAKALGMSPSALQFKLAKRETSFQDLLDGARKDLACAYVQQAAMSITEITFLLGFNDTSNFSRAFKRWTGVAPTQFAAQKKASH